MKKVYFKLSEYCPQAEPFWDPSLNEGVSFDDMICSKQDILMLRCDKNPKHIYPRKVENLYNRNNEFIGCKYCGKGAKEAFPGDNDFFTVCSEAKETWDYEKNAGVDPTTLLPGCNKQFWFTCKYGHSNLRKICYVAKNPECPDCADKEASLASLYPEILNIWDKGKNTIDPYTVRKSHTIPLYFKCPKCGYEWKRNAIGYPDGKFCAVCGYDGTEDGQQRNKAYIKEHPTITFRMANPEASKMWDYENNAFDANPDSLLKWSNYLASFKCRNGHRFKKVIAEMYDKHGNPIGCPYCENKVAVTGENDFFTVCKKAIEAWDYEKNTDIDPRKELASSQKKAYFKCKYGHERHTSLLCFNSSPDCPTCKKTVGAKPKMLKFWDSEENQTDPWQVYSNSRENYHWKCPECGHKWIMSPYDLVAHKYACQNCIRINKRNEALKHVPSFAIYNPKAAKLWAGSKNEDVTPETEPMSSKEIVTLRCANNPEHIYDIRVSKIPLEEPYGCPICSQKKAKVKDTLFDTVTNAKDMWDYESNKDEYPDLTKISARSTKRANFICKYGHVFNKRISLFRDNPVCPECKRLSRTVADYPHLLKQWDYERNSVDPHMMPVGSEDIAYWKCHKCGYTWETKVNSRINVKGECPCCELHVVTVPGINDLFTLVPELKAYYDEEGNEGIDINALSVTTSNIFVSWKCPDCGYKWSTNPSARVKGSYQTGYKIVGCPACSNHVRTISYAEQYPDLAEMYDESNPIPLDEIVKSNMFDKYNWKCTVCKHVFQSSMDAMIRSRTSRFRGCSYCAGKAVDRTESFAYLYPDLMDEYAPDNEIDPYTVTQNSTQIAKWICRNDPSHVWEANFQQRAKNWGLCPICKDYDRGKRVIDVFPELERYYDKDKNDRPFHTIAPYTNAPLNWICDMGHDFVLAISNFTKANRFYCPICENKMLRKGENDLLSQYPELAEEFDIEKNGMTPDEIKINSWDTGIWWNCKNGHSYQKEVHYRVFVNRECPVCSGSLVIPSINSLEAMNEDLAKEWSPLNRKPASDVYGDSNKTAYWTCPTCNGNYTAKIRKRYVGDDACPYCNKGWPLPGFNTLDVTDELLAKEWSSANNRGPDTVTKNMRMDAIWTCPTCHGDYSYSIADRQLNDDSCPYCNKGKILAGFNTLDVTDELLAKEWSSANDRGPDTVTKDMRMNAIWTCPTCHGDYSYSIADRQLDDDSCPYCNKGWPLAGFNTLDVTDELLAKEWSSANNRGPDTVTKKMRINAIWTCPTCHGDYSYSIADRQLDDDSCPYCNKGKILAGFNTLDVTDELLAKEWSSANNRGPDTVTKKMRINAIWTCPICQGDYSYSIADRQLNDDSCPYCNKGKALAGFNTLDVTDELLAKEWSEANNRGPDTVTKKMRINAIWTCPICQGDYSYSISDRQLNDDSCPYCNDRKPLKNYNTFAVKHKDLLEEWDYISNYLICDPNEILDTYQNNVWWKCKDCGRRYQLSPYQKVLYEKRHMKSCRFCKGYRKKLHRFF